MSPDFHADLARAGSRRVPGGRRMDAGPGAWSTLDV